jgi:hypothetical protein
MYIIVILLGIILISLNPVNKENIASGAPGLLLDAKKKSGKSKFGIYQTISIASLFMLYLAPELISKLQNPNG